MGADASNSGRMKWLRVVAAVAVLALATLASSLHGVPQTLPGAALGWRLLFHVERAAGILGLAGTIWLISWRGLRGEFPIRFGQIEYSAKETAQDAETVTKGLETRVRWLEAIVGIGDPPPLD